MFQYLSSVDLAESVRERHVYDLHVSERLHGCHLAKRDEQHLRLLHDHDRLCLFGTRGRPGDPGR